MNFLVPPNSNDMSHFLWSGIWIIGTGNPCYFGIYMTSRVIDEQLCKALSITEVPHSCSSITTCGNETSLCGIKATCSNFGSLFKYKVKIQIRAKKIRKSLLHELLRTLTWVFLFQCPTQQWNFHRHLRPQPQTLYCTERRWQGIRDLF